MSTITSTTIYAVASIPTPVYNTPDIPHLKPKIEGRDSEGLLKCLEIIALPDTKFTIVLQTALGFRNMCEVKLEEYPSSTPLYVDSRCLQVAFQSTFQRRRALPSASFIIKFMRSAVGVRYFWGGNRVRGIPEMKNLYPQLTAPEDQDDAICKGLDCSGLLYEATDGFTPRNTSQLFTYGQELKVNQESPEEVQNIVKPLDMMVWKGHVVFFLTKDEVIESIPNGGVTVSNSIERYCYYLKKLHDEKRPFSLRRWHPDFLT